MIDLCQCPPTPPPAGTRHSGKTLDDTLWAAVTLTLTNRQGQLEFTRPQKLQWSMICSNMPSFYPTNPLSWWCEPPPTSPTQFWLPPPCSSFFPPVCQDKRKLVCFPNITPVIWSGNGCFIWINIDREVAIVCKPKQPPATTAVGVGSLCNDWMFALVAPGANLVAISCFTIWLF